MADPQAPQPSDDPITVQVDGLGAVQFPAGTSEDVMKQAIDRKLAESHVTKGEPVPHPIVQRLLDWLPTVGGAAGGLIGGAMGLPEGGIGAVPGAVAGASVGGAAGASVAGMINHAIGNSPNLTNAGAGRDLATQTAVQGGSELAGTGLAAVAKPTARWLMQTSIKPAYADMVKAARKAEPPRVVKTLLDEGVNVTRSGVTKLNDLLSATNDQIADIIKNSNATIDPAAVATRADQVAARVGTQVAPAEDLAAVRKVTDQFLHGHQSPITVQDAQALKVGTYRAIGNRAYGEVRGAQTEAEKALARGLKEEIETATPGTNIRALNQRDAALMEARDAVAKRVALAGNRDPAGLGWVAENPKSFLAYVVSRSPAAKSMLARGLYKSAGVAAKVDPQLIRLAMGALVSSPDEAPQ